MYQVSRILISKRKYPQLHYYLAEQSRLAKNLHNAALFRVRQHFLAQGKDSLTANEKEVEQEVELLIAMGKKVHPVLSYTQLERLMRLTENPDFFSGLPMQTAQQVLKQTSSASISLAMRTKRSRSVPWRILPARTGR